jgi:hypothetical protein
MHVRRGEGRGIASDWPRHRGCVFFAYFFLSISFTSSSPDPVSFRLVLST